MIILAALAVSTAIVPTTPEYRQCIDQSARSAVTVDCQSYRLGIFDGMITLYRSMASDLYRKGDRAGGKALEAIADEMEAGR